MIPDKPPIFDYDPRYIEKSKYTLEELYKLQKIILQLRQKHPTTFTYELKKLDYDQKEIDVILTHICNS